MTEPEFTPQEAEQFEAAAAEAERGYSTKFLDSLPRLGRPARAGDQE
jgi:hypothetical protein